MEAVRWISELRGDCQTARQCKWPARLHPLSAPISLCPSESYARLRFLAMSARRLGMSRTLSPATSASSPCDGLAPPHCSGTCIDGDELDGEEHLLPSTLPPQPDRPGSCPR